MKTSEAVCLLRFLVKIFCFKEYLMRKILIHITPRILNLKVYNHILKTLLYSYTFFLNGLSFYVFFSSKSYSQSHFLLGKFIKRKMNKTLNRKYTLDIRLYTIPNYKVLYIKKDRTNNIFKSL